MKVCTKCNLEKNLIEFGLDGNSKDGYLYWCKKCNSIQSSNYRKNLVKKIGKEKVLELRRKKYSENKNHTNKLRAIRQKIRKKHFTEQSLKWQKTNPDKVKTSKLKYKSKEKNILKIKLTQKKYTSLSKNKKRRMILLKNRLKEDPLFKIHHTLRKHIANSLRNYLKIGIRIKKEEKSIELLGCTMRFFKTYLEKQFKEGMNWGNWGRGDGKWHVDHIRPLASFDLRILNDRFKAFNYKNQKPMWSSDNIRKSSIWNGKRYTIKDNL
tara:strand:- start:108 stop:908 length:801 start_codon:yes stop_codon:yes gene_type:complete